MQQASRVIADGNPFQIALAAPRPEIVPTAVKSSRFLRLSDNDVRGHRLSAEDIRLAHQRNLAIALARAEDARKTEQARAMALASLAPKPDAAAPALVAAGPSKPTVVSALVEDVTTRKPQPFDLVLGEDGEDAEGEAGWIIPDDIPLPEARPERETAIPALPPAIEKPSRGITSGRQTDVAVAKPERSLFGDLFKRKESPSGWPGRNTRVAIYDVSNATVYMPDGTRLRAHSGIGHMRDNPRYEHVTMRGPTPAGIYRLSMREKRFYGVEAIRMTSIDGRDPKNRTGLLTHTNLLRGQIGSHGCVAFQNYQPFLNAFKRGQVNMLVVVPELPSSPTQLAALYRKAGA